MSMIGLALNPNLTEAQFNELMAKKLESNERIKAHFYENLNSLKTDEQKIKYMQMCAPLLAMSMM